MIIALTTDHPAATQLATLTQHLRALRRGESSDTPKCVADALNISETTHGSHTSTFAIVQGHAASQDAIEAYQHIRKYYPAILDVLCHAASKNVRDITVEIGSMKQSDNLSYSCHELLRIMPRVLSLFRGTITPVSS